MSTVVLLALVFLYAVGRVQPMPIPQEVLVAKPDSFGDDIFEGFDCSQPRNVKDVGYVGDLECSGRAKIASTRNTSYQILQEEKYHRVNGTTCSLIMTRVVRYCGTYDHQTTFPGASLHEVGVPVTLEQCRKWYQNLEYRDNHDQAYPLKGNAVNVISYEEVGRTWVEGGEISCQGGTWKWGREEVYRVVVEVQVKVTLREEVYLLNNKEVMAHVEDVRLPCPASAHGCQLPLRTYLWESPNLDCDLAVARVAHGTEAESEKGEKVFISTDGSLVRLIRQDAVSLCGRVVHSTNYAGVFIYELDRPKQFTRPLGAGEVSLTLYIKNRDDFLYDNIVSALEEEFQGILATDCLGRSQRLKRDFWQQHKEPGATTWVVAKDVFATAVGEIIYQYQCQPTKVRAAHLPHCYQGLPVTLVQPRPAADGSPQAPKQLFLEPLTRRLMHAAVEVPCSRLFRAKYKNIHGGWIIAAPEIIPAASPRLPPTLEAHREIFASRPDWSKGGIYTEETLEAAAAYDDFSRTAQVVQATFAWQVSQDWKEQGSGYLSPEQVFPEFRDPAQWASKMWSKTRGFLHAWGEGAAIIFSVFAIGRIMADFASWAYGVAVLREMMGCTRHLVWTLCPNIFLLRQYREFHQAQPAAPPSYFDASAPVYDARGEKGVPISTALRPIVTTRTPVAGPLASLVAAGFKRQAPVPPVLPLQATKDNADKDAIMKEVKK